MEGPGILESILARLAAIEVRLDSRERIGADERAWVGPNAAAVLLDVKPRWIYDHWRRLPFARKIGGQLRFSVQLLRAWDGRLE